MGKGARRAAARNPSASSFTVFALLRGHIVLNQVGQDSVEQLIRSPMDLIRRKCTCKKSGCLKKYCDCYQGCKCEDCRNPFGRKVGVILDGKSTLAAPVLNERNGAEVDSSDEEDDYYMNRQLSPIPPSPVSRESSFQQETLVGVEVQTMNGHLYPKPLTQVRPEPPSWQISRRPVEEVRGEQWRFSRRPSEDGTPDAMEATETLLKLQSAARHRVSLQAIASSVVVSHSSYILFSNNCTRSYGIQYTFLSIFNHLLVYRICSVLGAEVFL